VTDFLGGRANRLNVVVVVAALATVGVALALFLTRRDPAERIRDQLARDVGAACEKLGAHLAGAHAGAKAMVILPYPPDDIEGQTAAMLAGLEKGFAGKIVIAVRHRPEMPPEWRDVDWKTAGEDVYRNLPPVGTWFTATALDDMIAEHGKGCDVVVCLAGLPSGAAALRAPRTDDSPVLAFLAPPGPKVEGLIASGAIAAAIVIDLGGPDNEGTGRYRLLTPDNIGVRPKQPS
jgi:hypothetical protein